MTDRQLVRDGVPIRYTLNGSGPLVGHAHGLFGSRRSEDWSDQWRFAPEWAASRRVLRYDARGHGATGGRPHAEDYRWDHLSSDLLALLDHLGETEPVDFTGASMGTGSLLWAAVQAPHRFRRLVLTIPPTAWSTRPAQVDQYRDLERLATEGGTEMVTRAFLAAEPHPVLGELIAEAVGKSRAGDPPPLPDITDELLPSVLRGAAASDLPGPEELSALTHPVLILAWAGDPGHPVSTSERLHEILPDSRLVVAKTLAEVREWGDRIADFLD